jgi:nucleotide-binding universal stress UspA family protein
VKILACIDNSRNAEDVLQHAAWVAKQMSLPVEILHALDRPTSAPAMNFSGRLGIGSREALLVKLAELDEQRNRVAQESGRHLLEGAVTFLREQGVEEIAQRLVHGSLADHMRDYDRDTQLIVVGKRGETSGSTEDHLGINLERIIRASSRPVLVTSGPLRPIGRLVIAFDGSASTGKAIILLVNQPLFREAEVHLVMVGDSKPARRDQLTDATARLRASGYPVIEKMIPGNPDEIIPEHVTRTGADLLIMGAYGHSRIREWVVGSTTTALLRTSSVPMLILR